MTTPRLRVRPRDLGALAFAIGAAALVTCRPGISRPPPATSDAPTTTSSSAPPGNAPTPLGGAPATTSRGGAMTIRFLDVGQGDAALVTTDDGHAMLIDAGPPEAAARMAHVLEARGGAPLDDVVLSHAHADHLGGLDALIARPSIAIGAWIDPGFAVHATPHYERALEALRARHVPAKVARRGDAFTLGAHVDVVVLAPAEPLFAHTRSDPNANSVVLRVDHHGARGDTRVLFEGDAEHPTEDRLLGIGAGGVGGGDRAALRADVLKVAHHGSKHASSDAVLDAVAPRLAVISCGLDNDYGHPHAQTLARLARHHVEIARTDVEGDVTVTSDDRGLRWSTEKTASPELLRAPGREASREAP